MNDELSDADKEAIEDLRRRLFVLIPAFRERWEDRTGTLALGHIAAAVLLEFATLIGRQIMSKEDYIEMMNTLADAQWSDLQ